jgi:preprotein translocase subunit SecD
MFNKLISLRCPDCGKNIADDDKTCPHCGADLESPFEEADCQALAQKFYEDAKNAYDRHSNLGKALQNIKRAIELYPEKADYYLLQGLILEAASDIDQAVLAYAAALQLNPDLEAARTNLTLAEAELAKKSEQTGLISNSKTRIPWKKILIVYTALMILLCLGGSGAALYFIARDLWIPKTSLTFEPDPDKISTQPDKAAIEETVNLLNERAEKSNKAGYHRAKFTLTQDNKINCQLPSYVVPEEFIEDITPMGLLEFVDMRQTYLPDGSIVMTDHPNKYLSQSGNPIYHTIMSNEDLSNASAVINQSGESIIDFSLTDKGTKIFADFTKTHVGNYLAIVLDKKIISCPSIHSAITEGKGQITGNFTLESANKLANQLQTSTPLPFPIRLSQK